MLQFLTEENLKIHKEYLRQRKLKLSIFEKSIEGIKNEQNVTNSVLYAEIDMLYEIFMAASLPQYLKDNVGEKVRVMKAKLNSEAKNEEC